MTTTGVGWVLVDATVPGGHPLDDDQFAIGDPSDLTPRCLAAVRGADAIAAASGHRITGIGVCWSADLDPRSAHLLAAVRGAGYPDVRAIREIRPSDCAALTGPADRAACVIDAGAILADLFAEGDSDLEFDTDSRDDADTHRVDCGPAAGHTPAYAAAHAVLTNTVPPEPIALARSRRDWSLPPLGARVLTLSGAAAVTAVIALFAVGSQFGGSELPESATLANRATVSTPQTSPIVPAAPEPVAAAAPAPAMDPVAAPEPAAPSPLAQPAPGEWMPPAQPVTRAEAAAPAVQVDAVQTDAVQTGAVQTGVVPEGVPHIPDPAAAGLAGPEPAPQAPPPPPPFLFAPPAPLFPPPPPPLPLFPPAPVLPPVEPLAAPAEPFADPAPVAAPAPAPVPPPPAVNPVFGALP